MAITYPIAFPSAPAPRSITFHAESVVGLQRSLFSGVQTVYSHSGEWFEASVLMPPMLRAQAEEWIAFLLKLNGKEGTFLMGDPVSTTPRGSWAWGSPDASVNGAHAAGLKTIALKDFVVGATGKAGDWIQFGSGSSTSLHKVVEDFTVGAGGGVSIEIWPRTKQALSNGDRFVVSSAKGLWRLKENRRSWSIEEAQVFGLSFDIMQAF